MTSAAGSVQACLAHCAPGDSLVLLNTAVNILLVQDWNKGLREGVLVYVPKADAAAQGFTQQSNECKFIDDSYWVELVIRHRHCLSWK